jgi:hypothetical protein
MEDGIDFKTFCIYAAACIVFGCSVGLGCYISFSPYDISITDGLSFMIILFIAGGTPAVFLRWWVDTHMNPDEEEEEDCEEEDSEKEDGE